MTRDYHMGDRAIATWGKRRLAEYGLECTDYKTFREFQVAAEGSRPAETRRMTILTDEEAEVKKNRLLHEESLEECSDDVACLEKFEGLMQTNYKVLAATADKIFETAAKKIKEDPARSCSLNIYSCLPSSGSDLIFIDDRMRGYFRGIINKTGIKLAERKMAYVFRFDANEPQVNDEGLFNAITTARDRDIITYALVSCLENRNETVVRDLEPERQTDLYGAKCVLERAAKEMKEDPKGTRAVYYVGFHAGLPSDSENYCRIERIR